MAMKAAGLVGFQNNFVFHVTEINAAPAAEHLLVLQLAYERQGAPEASRHVDILVRPYQHSAAEVE